MRRITLTVQKARALQLLHDNGPMTTAEINARMNFDEANLCGSYSILVGMKNKGYVEMERDTTPNKAGQKPIIWTISQSGIKNLAFLQASIGPEPPKLAPRVRASFHVGTYRPTPWVSARSDADDHRQYASRGTLC